jgi:transcriptional regulator GlxA family with amidase domain
VLSSIIGPYKVLNQANDCLAKMGKKPAFYVELAGLEKNAALYQGRFEVHPDLLIKDVIKTDIVIMPAFAQMDELPCLLDLNKEVIPWIKKQHVQGAELASLCTGAFLLAATGLLAGKKCVTHWMAVDAFRKMYPEVQLLPEKIIIDEKGIYSRGGAYSFLNLIIHLVEKYCGRETAIFCSKVFEIDIDRSCQASFAIFSGQKDHEDEPIKKAQTFIETNVADKISVDSLASMLALSRRNFERRFKKATANTPAEYLQRVKIEVAKKNLESGSDNINEVMYSVGYSDGKAFRTTFKKITDLSPVEYRNKYNRLIVI